MSKVLKVTLKDGMTLRLSALAQRDGLAEAEVVRRALLEYFERHIQPASIGPGSGQDRATYGPGLGQDRARIRPDHGPMLAGQAVPSSSPPPFPSALPKSSPSLSPPLLFGDEGDSLDQGPPPGALLEFRCIRGKKSEGTRWYLTGELVRRWEAVYPDMDILAEARRAREYAEANGLKTSNGMKAYLVKWFNRSQNNGRYARRITSSVPPAGSPSLQDVYGYATWEEWEAALRQHLAGGDLELELQRLGEIRGRWEGGVHAA